VPAGPKSGPSAPASDFSRHDDFAGGSWDVHPRTEFSFPPDLYARVPATHASGAVTLLPARKGNCYHYQYDPQYRESVKARVQRTKGL
jgi:hypothetical protein